MGFRVMDKTQGKYGKIIRESEAADMGFLQTPRGQLVRIVFIENDGGGVTGYFEEISKEKYGILNVIGTG